jgi:hypothetical protein
MTYHEQWSALAARIEGIKEAGSIHARMLSFKLSDEFNASSEIVLQCRSVIDALQEFAVAHEAALPAAAKAELARFLDSRLVQAILSNTDMFRLMRVGTVVLPAFASGFTYLLRGRQELIRLRSARGFELLQRLLVVDPDTRKKWLNAFYGKGETTCEQLGAVHLLSQGIHAFKINAAGARTDLVFNEPLNVSRAAQTSEGLVLTEWKVARADDKIAAAFREARQQVDLYQEGPLAGLELAGYRYLVVVTERQAPHTTIPQGISSGGVVYEPINIAISPRTPSAQSKQK